MDDIVLLYSSRWPVSLSLFNLISFISFLCQKGAKTPGTRKNQSQQPSAHESQATSFVRLLFDANSFSFNHRGQK
ncbi:MAG: hypothetical protein IKL54_07075, partial [Bacteroidaceae bacterium]|nr:hypothetical protein [Bacteroidaceae bacterium]